MASNSDSRTRLIEILNSGLEPTLADLAARLGITTERHVRRLLADLRREGYEIEEYRVGRIKRFRIPEEKRQLELRPLRLTEDQTFALAVAAEASRATLASTPLGEPLNQAFAELMATFSSDVITFEVAALGQHWHFGSAQTVPIDPTVFRRIARAIEECRSIRIDYLTASTGRSSIDRLVDPLALAVQGGTWLLVAYCHRRQEIRDFALAGISRVELCDPEQEAAYFTRPTDFDPDIHFRDRFVALSGTDYYTVRLQVDPLKAVYFDRKLYHPTQQIEARLEDRSIVVSFEVAGLEEIRSFIQSWGSGVVVLDPPELVERIREDAASVLAKYSDSGVSVDES